MNFKLEVSELVRRTGCGLCAGQQLVHGGQNDGVHSRSTYIAKSLSHGQLCTPMEYCPPGSSVHGIFLARILKWVAIPSSRGIFPLTLKLPKPDETRHVDTVLFSPTKQSLPSRDGQQERSREEGRKDTKAQLLYAEPKSQHIHRSFHLTFNHRI